MPRPYELREVILYAEPPAILGPETSFQALRRSELDYIQVRSVNDVEAALMKLRQDPDLRSAMASNGRERWPELNPTATRARWVRFLDDYAGPACRNWCRLGSLGRMRVRFRRTVNYAFARATRQGVNGHRAREEVGATNVPHTSGAEMDGLRA